MNTKEGKIASCKGKVVSLLTWVARKKMRLRNEFFLNSFALFFPALGIHFSWISRFAKGQLANVSDRLQCKLSTLVIDNLRLLCEIDRWCFAKIPESYHDFGGDNRSFMSLREKRFQVMKFRSCLFSVVKTKQIFLSRIAFLFQKVLGEKRYAFLKTSLSIRSLWNEREISQFQMFS